MILQFEDLKGVGTKLKDRFLSAGFRTPFDLLFHLPRAYQDRTRIMPIQDLPIGGFYQVVGHITKKNMMFGRARSLQVWICDATGRLSLRFFHFLPAQVKSLQEGVRLQCFGEVRLGREGPEMVHPEYKILREGEEVVCENHYTPIYPTVLGLTQNQWRRSIKQLLDTLVPSALEEIIQPEDLSSFQFPSLDEALRIIHFPKVTEEIDRLKNGTHPARKRLAFEELLAHRLVLRVMRQKRQSYAAFSMRAEGSFLPIFLKQLPFELTLAQQKVWTEIGEDLSRPLPMMRLLQGDVGSGKTVIAGLAVLKTVENSRQACIMAPTEVLAEQLFLQFKTWMDPLGLSLALLTGQTKTSERRKILKNLAEGQIQVIVGTHALFQSSVQFKSLGLLVIDEQHRFGVEQRNQLFEKGISGGYAPHQLVMTATPIPRTLAMVLYADLDLSIINMLPSGRIPIQTLIMTEHRRKELSDRIRIACQNGAQVYWVCTLIDESEVLKAQNAEATYQILVQELPDLKIGLIHGRLSSSEKSACMRAFKALEIHVLVATTVIEVGVDVQNASIMVIENPERLGLSQLHQLRGRVGRGSRASFCIFLIAHNLSVDARERLRVFQSCQDGFQVADLDLALRGPGEMLGKRQSGALYFKVADLQSDSHLLPGVQRYADQVLCYEKRVQKVLTSRWLGDEPLILS